MSPAVTERFDTERLRQQHPIADVVARYGIELRRSGSAFIGRCPFHADAGRPNLVVYPRSARFVCFRCQARGDAIAFIQQIEQLSFRDAAQRLDACAALSMPRVVRRRGPIRHRSSVRTEDEGRALAAAVELYANRLLETADDLPRYLGLPGPKPLLG
jgi:DNA primase